MERVLLIGASLELIDLLKFLSFEVVGIIDKEKKGKYYGYEILGDDEWLVSNRHGVETKALVIPFDNSRLKKRLAVLYAKNGFWFPEISAEPPKSCTHFSQGVIVQRHVHVSTNCTIGCFTKINVGANVMHDVVLEDYCTIAPNAVLLGGVKIGEGTMVGAHATILPHIRIGKYATVGAGAVVTKDVPDSTVVKGVPAR